METPAPENPSKGELDAMAARVAARDGITIEAAREKVLAMLHERYGTK